MDTSGTMQNNPFNLIGPQVGFISQKCNHSGGINHGSIKENQRHTANIHVNWNMQQKTNDDGRKETDKYIADDINPIPFDKTLRTSVVIEGSMKILDFQEEFNVMFRVKNVQDADCSESNGVED